MAKVNEDNICVPEQLANQHYIEHVYCEKCFMLLHGEHKCTGRRMSASKVSVHYYTDFMDNLPEEKYRYYGTRLSEGFEMLGWEAE